MFRYLEPIPEPCWNYLAAGKISPKERFWDVLLIFSLRGFLCFLWLFSWSVPVAPAVEKNAPLVEVSRQVQPKMVKIFGAGGLRGLESYQSGLLISADGHVLTAWSYILDTDSVTAILNDGRRFRAKFVGADLLTEMAVLKLAPFRSEEESPEESREPFPYFDLSQSVSADVGTRVLAFSNLFGIATGEEPVSVLHGCVSAVAPLMARRGAFSTRYRGDVYVVDAQTNNPGAAGGALTDSRGRLLGMLGKEVRSELTNTWLSYALPVEVFATTAHDILEGQFTQAPLDELDQPDRPLTMAWLGLVLVPDVIARTPPYVDRVLINSPAEAAGLRPDDLIVMVNQQVITSCADVVRWLARYEQDAAIRLTLLRGEALIERVLQKLPTD